MLGFHSRSKPHKQCCQNLMKTSVRFSHFCQVNETLHFQANGVSAMGVDLNMILVLSWWEIGDHVRWFLEWLLLGCFLFSCFSTWLVTHISNGISPKILIIKGNVSLCMYWITKNVEACFTSSPEPPSFHYLSILSNLRVCFSFSTVISQLTWLIVIFKICWDHSVDI